MYTASKLYDKLRYIHLQLKMIILQKIRRKRLNVLKSSQKLAADFVEADLPPKPPLERDGQVKLKPEEIIAEGLKSNSQERKETGTGLKVLTPNKFLTKFPMLLSQIK